MLRLLRKTKAQSTAEYAILIGLVVATIIGIQTYVKRGLQGRFKDATDDYVNGVGSDTTNWSTISSTSATLSKQFEDTRLSSQSTQDTLQDDLASEMQKDGTITRGSTRRTKQQAGDYQKYDY